MFKPRRGTALVRPCATQETLPGGRIIIPQSSREQFAAYQVDILAVGEPEFCGELWEANHLWADEECDCEREHELVDTPSPDDPYGFHFAHPIDPRIRPGAWAIVSPRSYLATGTPNEYLVSVEDIEAVLGED